MFARRLTELKARELELRLRSMALREELREDLRVCRAGWAGPLLWARVAGGGLGLAGLLLRLRHGGRSRQVLGWLRLGLRAARLWRQLSANPATASSSPASEPKVSPPP